MGKEANQLVPLPRRRRRRHHRSFGIHGGHRFVSFVNPVSVRPVFRGICPIRCVARRQHNRLFSLLVRVQRHVAVGSKLGYSYEELLLIASPIRVCILFADDRSASLISPPLKIGKQVCSSSASASLKEGLTSHFDEVCIAAALGHRPSERVSV